MHWYRPDPYNTSPYPPCYPFPYSYGRPPQGAYPPVEVTRFRASARSFIVLSNQAEQLSRKIVEDETFANSLKSAAQENNLEKVKQLLDQTPITSAYDVKYTPDGMKIKLRPKDEQECAALVLDFCW